MSLGTIASLSAQSATHMPILLFDITSVEDGTVLYISQLPCTFNGNSYSSAILSVTGFDLNLSDSQLGIMAIQNISLVLGDANATYTNWDNAHYFKGATMTVTLVIYDEATKTAASSDSRVLFKGICNAPDEVTPDQMTISAFNRFNATFMMIPFSRISQFSQTVFPPDGATDCNDANANPPSSPASVGYHLWAPGGLAASEALYLPYNSCAYGPTRGEFGFPGSNPMGNFVVPQTTANIYSSTTIGNTGLSMSSGENAGNFVIIVTGTGAGQARAIASNTATTLTVQNPFATTPDGTSTFVVVYGTCDLTAASCQAHGMYGQDSSSRNCYRNRGISFVPTDWTYEQPNGNNTLTTTNPDWAKYNDVIPLVYGTGRVTCKILFSQTANDTRGQAIVCEGPVQSISNMLINSSEMIPFNAAYPHHDTTTGMWTCGLGALGQNYTDVWFPDGDPYSGIAIVSFNFPPAFANGSQNFQVSVLVQGLALAQYDNNGNFVQTAWTDNPAWIILDVLRRAGWQLSELNLPSFYAFAVYAAQQINAYVSSTCTAPFSRFRMSVVLDQQMPVGEFLSTLLNECRAVLTYDTNGLMRLDCLNRLTNTTTASTLAPGTNWVEVDDGAGITIGSVLTIDTGANQETVTVTNIQLVSNAFEFEATFANSHASGVNVIAEPAFSFDLSSITRDQNDYPTLTRSSMNTSQTPNDFVVELQNSLSQWTQDQAELMDTLEANNFGAKVTGQLDATGFEDVDSAVRIEQLQIYLNHGRRNAANQIINRGNLFVTLTTSIKAINVPIGGIVYLTYAKEGWTNKPFRVVGVSPTQDQQFPYWEIQLQLREHDDTWYDVINGNIEPPPNTVTIAPTPTIRLPLRPPFPQFPIFN